MLENDSRIHRLIHKGKQKSMAVDRNKRKRGESESRSKDARWTPCLPPGPFLQQSMLPPSDASPSWIKYPWKDGLLFSIVLNNRHSQQIRQEHHIDSNTNIKQRAGQRNKPDEADTQGGRNLSTPDTVSSENATLESTAEIRTFMAQGILKIIT